MKQSTKKIVAASVAICMGMTMLAGCGRDSDSSNDKSEKVKGNGKKQEITLMASQNWIKDVDNELFDAFEKKTGIEVKVSLTPDNEYKTLLGTILSGGSDAVDMFMSASGLEMLSAGTPEIAVDLSNEKWVGNMQSWAVEANSADGNLYGFSTWGIDFEGVLYNKTFFEEHELEVPETWADFMALCDQIKALGVTPFYEPINGTWHAQSWVYGMTPLMYEEKPDFVEYLNEGKDNKFADLKCFKEGLTQIQQLLSEKEGNAPKYHTNDGQAEDWFGSYTAMQSRETVMLFTYSAYAAELAANGALDEYGMFPLPVLDNKTAVSNGGGISKFINRNSKNIDACKQLLDFLAEKENLETYYEARTDLVTSAFKNVKSVHATTATTEILERTEKKPVPIFTKNVLHWSPDVYKDLQGLADGTTTPDDFTEKVDQYRATMFDTVAE